MRRYFSMMPVAAAALAILSGCTSNHMVYRSPEIKPELRMLVLPLDVNDPGYFISDKFDYMDKFVSVFARELKGINTVNLSADIRNTLDREKVKSMVENTVNHYENLLTDRGLLGKGVTVKPFGETVWPATGDDAMRTGILSLLAMAGNFDAFAFIVIDMQQSGMPQSYKSIARVLIIDPKLNVIAFARTEGFGAFNNTVEGDSALAADLARAVWDGK
jgi:hypothetical protein